MKKIMLVLCTVVSLFGHERLSAQCIDSSLITNGPCPLIWMPVCGCNGITYGNDCEAVNWGGVTDFTPGECGSQVECVDSSLIDLSVLCPLIWAPVCGCDGITYSNECSAINYGGVTEFVPGECLSSGCSVEMEDELMNNFDLRLNAAQPDGIAPFYYTWTVTSATGMSIMPSYTSAGGDTIVVSAADLFNNLSCVIVNMCMTDASGCSTCVADTSFGGGNINCVSSFTWVETTPGSFIVVPSMSAPAFLYQSTSFEWAGNPAIAVGQSAPFNIEYEPVAYDPNGYDFQACMVTQLASGICIDCQTMHASPDAFTTGTKGLNSLPVTVQPNPVGDVMSIVSGDNISGAYQLMDITGRLILEGSLQGQQTTVQLQGVPVGMYLLRVTDTAGRSNSMRILKK